MKAPARLLVLLAVAVAGCSSSSSSPHDEVRQLAKAGSFELYSLEPLADPNTYEMDYDPNGPGERLHGWRVLGKTTVSDEAPRLELIEALKEDLKRQGPNARCFYPRHAIRRTDNGKPVDLLICFECGNIALYRDGKRVGGYGNVGGNVQSTFDEALRKAGVPLAKKKQKPKG
jgi:hypothetical protein